MPRDPPTGTQRELDEALEASFPASDPPSMTAPVIARAPRETHSSETATSRPKMVGVYRVVPRKQADAPFDHQGNQAGGRWTSPGVPAVYASLSPAGAVLEFIAHLDGEKPVDLMLAVASVPAECVVASESLPPNWRERPYRDDVRALGDRWVASRRSLALQLPSVLCEHVQNLLINPEHADAARIKIDHIEPFTLDPRLLNR